MIARVIIIIVYYARSSTSTKCTNIRQLIPCARTGSREGSIAGGAVLT